MAKKRLSANLTAAAAAAGAGTSGSGKGATSGATATAGSSAASTSAPMLVPAKHNLMSAFTALRVYLRQLPRTLLLPRARRAHELNTPTEDADVDALVLLGPFLDVVRSPETSGPITASALAAVDKFLSYGVVHARSPSLPAAMHALAQAGTHCKFEASDAVSDELVLLRILDVLRAALDGPLGNSLADSAVCEMMETGLSMCCQMRLSEMLRRSAERAMHKMVAAVFARLAQLDRDSMPPTASTTPTMPSSAVSDSTHDLSSGLRVAAPDPRSAAIPAAARASPSPSAPTRTPANEVDTPELAVVPEQPTAVEADETYGLPSVHELLRVLVSLLDPYDQQHTDSMRLLSLGLLNTAFEVAGRSVGRYPPLRALVADTMSKHLFQLARGAHGNAALLASALRCLTCVFDTLGKPYLKLQLELFLSFIVDRLVVPPDAPPGHLARKQEIEARLDGLTWRAEPALKDFLYAQPVAQQQGREQWPSTGSFDSAKELLLELVAQVARRPQLARDLWANYDCDVECDDVFERLVRFFCRGVYGNNPGRLASTASADNGQLLCLDTVLELVAQAAARVEEDEGGDGGGEQDADELRKKKSHKKLLLDAAAAFNKKPKTGVAFLRDHGLISSTEDVKAIARFLRETPRIDKRLLGDYISRPDQVPLLREFMRSLDFGGKIVCDALRELLEAFRLPGESQQIARITETFAEIYFATKPREIDSSDATYVLAYSIIMLNTDQHNPQVRRPMDLDAYARNLRGVNDGKDFEPDYLRSIYDSIRKREIVMPEEHQNQLGFEYGWKQLLLKSRAAGPFAAAVSGRAVDAQMFEVAWRPIVGAMAHAFAHFRDDYMIQRLIAGFNECATLAATFDMPDVIDAIIACLSRITGLVQDATATDAGTFPVVDVEGQKVTVSPTAVRFGADVKAQLAAVVVFTIANQHARSIRTRGWVQLFEMLQTLFVHSLLPAPLVAAEDFLSGTSAIPLKPKSVPVPRDDRRSDGGLLSTLSSYLISPYGGNAPDTVQPFARRDFTDDDIEGTLSSMDCIASCRVEDLYAQLFELDGLALVPPTQALITLAQRATLDRARPRAGSISAHGDRTPTPRPGATTANATRSPLPYDPSAVFLVEVMTGVVVRSPSSIDVLWPHAFDFLGKLAGAATSFSSLLNERVVAALTRMCAVAVQSDDLRDSVFVALDTLRGLPPPVLASVAEPLMLGLARFMQERAARLHSSTEWTLVFSLFSAASQHDDEAARVAFELVRALAAGKLGGAGLQPDNYAPFLQFLSSYANANPSPAAAESEAYLQKGRQTVEILRETHAAIPGLIARSSLSPARGECSALHSELPWQLTSVCSMGDILDPAPRSILAAVPQPGARTEADLYRQHAAHLARARNPRECRCRLDHHL